MCESIYDKVHDVIDEIEDNICVVIFRDVSYSVRDQTNEIENNANTYKQFSSIFENVTINNL